MKKGAMKMGEEDSRADRKIGIKFLINILEDVSAAESRCHFLNYSVTIKFLRAAAATGRQRRRSSLSTLRTASGMKADRASVNANARANERRVLGSVTKI